MNVAIEKEKVTRITAIKRFFEMSAGDAMRECKDMKQRDPEGYRELGNMAAEALGLEISEVA